MSEDAVATERPLAPWITTQAKALLAQRGHAWLLHGPSGLGQYDLALSLVRAWLCESPIFAGPSQENSAPSGGSDPRSGGAWGQQPSGLACGQCTSCHAVDVRTHADLYVLMPETDMLELGWPLSEKAAAEIDDKKRKASKEIRVDAMRDAIEFSQRTSSRGRGKAVLVYPAERMNGITANALLKTLEEPPGDVKFVLASESAHQLLPTIRSRCLGHAMLWPQPSDSVAWLQQQDLTPAAAEQFLRLAGGRPDDALTMARSGLDPAVWGNLPKAMAQGDVQLVRDWGVPQLVDALQKLCHDLLALQCGAEPRFFAPRDLAGIKAPLTALSQWQTELSRCMRTMEHPFNAGLMQEALVGRAQTALNSKP